MKFARSCRPRGQSPRKKVTARTHHGIQAARSSPPCRDHAPGSDSGGRVRAAWADPHLDFLPGMSKVRAWSNAPPIGLSSSAWPPWRSASFRKRPSASPLERPVLPPVSTSHGGRNDRKPRVDSRRPGGPRRLPGRTLLLSPRRQDQGLQIAPPSKSGLSRALSHAKPPAQPIHLFASRRL